MDIKENVNLAPYSTMRLGGQARYVADAKTKDDVRQLVDWAKQHELPVITIGGGSNVVWREEGFGGLLIVNKLLGKKILDEDEQTATVEIAGGENWDEVVAWSVSQNLSGIEALSLIPGSAGATPVQNVEAYGQAIADTMLYLEAYDCQKSEFIKMSPEDCRFSYRNSRFKSEDHGRFVITSIVLRLKKGQMQPPFHGGLQNYIDEHKITDFSPASIRKAVITIRTTKLPNPDGVPNNGSFFKNPIIESAQFEKLKAEHPDILNYPAGDKIKISAQWLIEHAGFPAGYEDEATGMALWPKHALVVINKHAKTAADLMRFKQKIVDAVAEKFGITLEQEPELLP